MNVYIDYNCIDDGSSFRSSHMLFHIIHKDAWYKFHEFNLLYIFIFIFLKKLCTRKLDSICSKSKGAYFILFIVEI